MYQISILRPHETPLKWRQMLQLTVTGDVEGGIPAHAPPTNRRTLVEPPSQWTDGLAKHSLIGSCERVERVEIDPQRRPSMCKAPNWNGTSARGPRWVQGGHPKGMGLLLWCFLSLPAWSRVPVPWTFSVCFDSLNYQIEPHATLLNRKN